MIDMLILNYEIIIEILMMLIKLFENIEEMSIILLEYILVGMIVENILIIKILLYIIGVGILIGIFMEEISLFILIIYKMLILSDISLFVEDGIILYL